MSCTELQGHIVDIDVALSVRHGRYVANLLQGVEDWRKKVSLLAAGRSMDV